MFSHFDIILVHDELWHMLRLWRASCGKNDTNTDHWYCECLHCSRSIQPCIHFIDCQYLFYYTMDELNLPAECYGFPFQPACWMTVTSVGKFLYLLTSM